MLRTAIAFAVAALLAGCNTVVPYKDVYDGLLPAGQKLQDAPAPLRADQLKSKTVVLVTSTNFDTYTTTWQGYWEKGGAQQQQIGRASDPRLVVSRVYSAFQPIFKEVKAASDFAQALAMKADYIALLDYHGTFNEMGDRYRTRGGIYFLDGSLRKVFEAQGAADVERAEGSLFGGVSEQYTILAQTYTKGLEITLGQVLSQARARLGQ